MQRFAKLSTALAGALMAILLVSTTVLADAGGGWPSAGNDLQNTRYQNSESKIKVSNVATLAPKWVFTAGGDVSATPAVDGATVYVPDWAGNLYAVDRKTGQQVWKASIAAATGVPFDKARATPAVAGDKVIIGTQGFGAGPGGGPGGKVLAFDKNTGALVWSTTAGQPSGGDHHPVGHRVRQPRLRGRRLAGGGAGGLRARLPVAAFRGSMLALDLDTGAILWKTYTAPAGLHRQRGLGQLARRSTPSAARSTSRPATTTRCRTPVLACVAAAGIDSSRTGACLAADDYFDSDPGARPEDRARSAGRRGRIAVRRLDRRLHPLPRRRQQLPRAGRPRLRLRPGAGAVHREDRRQGQAPRPGRAPARRAASTGRSTPTRARCSGSPRPAPAARPAACSGARPSTAQRVYTANANSNYVPGLPDGAARPAASGAAWMPRPAQVLWQTRPPRRRQHLRPGDDGQRRRVRLLARPRRATCTR